MPGFRNSTSRWENNELDFRDGAVGCGRFRWLGWGAVGAVVSV